MITRRWSHRPAMRELLPPTTRATIWWSREADPARDPGLGPLHPARRRTIGPRHRHHPHRRWCNRWNVSTSSGTSRRSVPAPSYGVRRNSTTRWMKRTVQKCIAVGTTVPRQGTRRTTMKRTNHVPVTTTQLPPPPQDVPARTGRTRCSPPPSHRRTRTSGSTTSRPDPAEIRPAHHGA